VGNLQTEVGNLQTEVGNLQTEVGNLSLKGCVGKADIAPVFGWQSDSERVGNNELPSLI
jgi:hypothetical protein